MKISQAKATFGDMKFLDKHDHAFIGIAQSESGDYIPCYSWDKIKKDLIKNDGVSEKDADELIEFNIRPIENIVLVE